MLMCFVSNGPGPIKPKIPNQSNCSKSEASPPFAVERSHSSPVIHILTTAFLTCRASYDGCCASPDL